MFRIAFMKNVLQKVILTILVCAFAVPLAAFAQGIFVNTGGLYNNGGVTNYNDLMNTTTQSVGGITNTITTATSSTQLNTNQLYTTTTAASSSSGATCNATIHTIGDLFTFAACFINRFLITTAISLAVLYFMWGVLQYVLAADSVEERKKSRDVILWGVFAIFIIVSMWAIVGAMRTILKI